MSDFTEQEFNEAMARLQYPNECDNWIKGNAMNNYHSDLNQLMPIAWKYGIYVKQLAVPWWRAEVCPIITNNYQFLRMESEDPVEAIRQCLWQIYKEQT